MNKTYGQAQSIASTLLQWPTHTALVIYKDDSTAESIKGYLREWVPAFPYLADWEKRVTFRKFDEKPKLETLPKITIDEWPEMPMVPREVWDHLERLNRGIGIITGADPQILKQEKEKDDA